MNVRAFLVGLSIGVVAAVVPSCGTTTRKCLRSNCAGCCDQNDECQTGTAPFACGADGRTCSSCMPGQACAAGVCIAGMTGGGAAGGSAGGTGGGSAGGAPLCANCNGCCDNGACRGGNTFTACGQGGAACQNCQAQNKACNTMGQCISFTCPGCVTDAGACTPGNSNLACGSDAGVCSQCASNQTCFGGACVTATTCGPANCGGCCDGTTCVQTPSAMKCGAGGGMCVTCGGGLVCSSGSCVSGAGGGSATGGGAGGSSAGGGTPMTCSCLTGCCGAGGACVAGDDPGACGNPTSNNGNCRRCGTFSTCLPLSLLGQPLGGTCFP
jgi:hypothetical protein